ncbi:MAG: hypothetical protein K6E94_07445, partial [Elusimicrobiaceae bacterium]|nr:hypothetical protein [Elusimicrobiaceae bacterium]
MKKIFNKKFVLFCKKAISLSLAFLILFNVNAEAFADFITIEQFLPEGLQEGIEEILTESTTKEEQKTPQEYLSDLLKQLEEASKEGEPEPEDKDSQNNTYRKLYQEEYNKIYTDNIDKEYKKYTQNIETEAKNAIAAFDAEAQKVMDEYTNSSSANTQKFTLSFSTPKPQKLFNNIPTQTTNIKDLENAIAKSREEYIAEVDAWKKNTLAALKTEKKQLLSKVDESYQNYSQEYNKNLQEFYKSLVEEVVENFKQTNDMESKNNFVSILLFLTSIKSLEIDRKDFIVGDTKKFILDFLKDNFSVEGNACSSAILTRYKENYKYGQVRAIGGSPSAGVIFENSDSKEQYLHIDDQEKCDLALSSMIPFANLGGDGYSVLNFLKQYYNQPLFGSMLAIGVKSLLLTDNNGDEALTKLIDESIKLENEARIGKTDTWSQVVGALEYITLEGITKSLSYDAKFCHHNLCSSANLDPNAPNAWEEVAYMLADEGYTDLLAKAVYQCRLVPSSDKTHPIMTCDGIYPFLFGALIAKPELAEKIGIQTPYIETVGEYLDRNGNIHYLNATDAEINKKKNREYKAQNHYSNGEWVAALLTLQSFEDLYPEDILRMNNLVADSIVLNPMRGYPAKYTFQHYEKNSDWYRKKVSSFNRKQILLALTAYADFLIAIIAFKDLIRFGFTIAGKGLTFAKMMTTIRRVGALPNSFQKSVKLVRLLEAKKVAFPSFKKFVTFSKNPLAYVTTPIVAKAGVQSQALIVSVSGRITGAKNGVLVGTQEFVRPLSGPYKSKVVFQKTPMGGVYPVAGLNNLRVAREEATGFKGAMAKIRTSIKESPLNPFIKPTAKDAPHLDLSNLSLEVLDKKGNPLKIEKITIEDNVLYINGEMFKTFKAVIPEDQLDIINGLIGKHGIKLGMDGFYIKPLWAKAPRTSEKVAARWKNSEMFNIYDTKGNVVMQMGLNRAYKQDLNLLKRLSGNARLVYQNGKLLLEEGGQIVKLEGLKGISLPKTAIFNMTKNAKVDFLTDLFSMPKKTGFTAPLRFNLTGSKITWPYLANMLSYSAASSSLMMTMEREPFNLSPGASVAIGLFLPYMWSFASPFLVPLVKLWGAKPVLLGSLGIASLSLGVAILNGYHGNVTNELDAEGRIIPKLDANGNIIPNSYEIRKNRLPVWPLFFTSFATGLASAGMRATTNILIKGYELNRRSLTVSMLFKNLGGMAFTAIPFVANTLSKMDGPFKDKKKDFSFTYPVLLGLTVLVGTGIAMKMPKMNVPGYKPVKADFLKTPWKLLFTKEIAPYTFGMMGISSLEGYVYFKGVNAFARDTFEDYGFQSENAKFMSSLFTAIPQFTLRLISPRKVFYGHGLFNSALLATTGTLILTLPSNDLSREANTALGVAAGIMLGLGTAQVYQYSQKLVIAQAAKMPGAPIKDAQTLYSMSNLGLAVPSLYAISANRRKTELHEGEFEATKNTFYLPLIFYFAGAAAIADAEKGFKVIPGTINQVLKPTVRFSIEGANIGKNIQLSNTNFKPALNKGTQFTPNILPEGFKGFE